MCITAHTFLQGLKACCFTWNNPLWVIRESSDCPIYRTCLKTQTTGHCTPLQVGSGYKTAGLVTSIPLISPSFPSPDPLLLFRRSPLALPKTTHIIRALTPLNCWEVYLFFRAETERSSLCLFHLLSSSNRRHSSANPSSAPSSVLPCHRSSLPSNPSVVALPGCSPSSTKWHL